MSLAEAWQRPAADDINSDALEYLLAPKRGKRIDPPWVKMTKDVPAAPRLEAAPPAPAASEVLRLQTVVEVLTGRLEVVALQLQNANYEIGYVKAQLAAKDEQLQQLAEYRARAAKAILSDIEKERLLSRVRMLEEIVVAFEQERQSLNRVAAEPADENACLTSPLAGMQIDDCMNTAYPKRRFVLSTEPFIVGFTISLAIMFLAKLLVQ